MTLSVYPTLAGLTWPLVRTPVWKTGIQPTQSGRELRAAYMSYPLYKWSAVYDVLRTAAAFTEYQQLLGFFNLCNGSFQAFLFQDPDDYAALTQGFGTGDGSTKIFTMIKSFGGFAEPAGYIMPASPTPTIFINGASQSPGNFTLNSPANGMITFVTAPGAGTALTWTGNYQYVCRFLADTVDFEKFNGGNYSVPTVPGLYAVKKIEWQSIKP